MEIMQTEQYLSRVRICKQLTQNYSGYRHVVTHMRGDSTSVDEVS